MKFTKTIDIDRICHDYYKYFYNYKEIIDEIFLKVMEDLLTIFTDAMNVSLDKISRMKTLWYS